MRVTLLNGTPVTEDHREINPVTGLQKDYVVLSQEDRDKGFVRQAHESYVHKPCGSLTRLARGIAETFARDPSFYNGTFCVNCKAHYPLHEFVWAGTAMEVGT
jgi:hypothetical protein